MAKTRQKEPRRVSSSNSGNVNNNSTIRRKSKDKNWRLLPKTKCGCCMCIFGSLSLIFVIVMLTIYSNYLTFVSKHNRNISDILNGIVEYANELQTIETEYKRIVGIDPFAELVENQVMPVHDKMSSTKRQIKIYEDMERIPGGPTNFMESSFKDINYIENKIHEFERQYGLILVSMRKELDHLSADSRVIYTKLMEVIDDMTLEKLRAKGIFLDDPDSKLRQNPGKSFQQVIELLSELANVFAKWEEPKNKLTDILKTQQITELHQTFGTPAFELFEAMTKCQRDIDKFLNNYEKYIRLTFMFFEHQLEGFRKAEEDIVETQTKFKLRYDRLTEMLTDDIFNARERVKNLRFASKKRSEL